jgi:hypothetical protein
MRQIRAAASSSAPPALQPCHHGSEVLQSGCFAKLQKTCVSKSSVSKSSATPQKGDSAFFPLQQSPGQQPLRYGGGYTRGRYRRGGRKCGAGWLGYPMGRTLDRSGGAASVAALWGIPARTPVSPPPRRWGCTGVSSINGKRCCPGNLPWLLPAHIVFSFKKWYFLLFIRG